MRKKEHPYFVMLYNTLKDTVKNIQRRNLMSFASVVCLVAALLVLAAFIIISINLGHISQTLEDSLQLKVFLNNELTENEIVELEEAFDSNEDITGYTYESNDEALEKYMERLDDFSGILEGYNSSNNPVSNSYTVQVTSPEYLEEVKIELESAGLPAINYVKYGDNYLEAVLMFRQFSNVICLIVFGLLALISIVIIYNTIKLTCYSNRKEIEIMQYIGAANWYIKLPFFFEGMLLGLLAAVCATMIVAVCYIYLLGFSNTLAYLPLNAKLVAPRAVLLPIMFFSALFGVLIGSFGSLFSIRKYFSF